MSDSGQLLRTLLTDVVAGNIDIESAASQLEATGSATQSDPSLNLDILRAERCGFPEAIYGQGKTADVILEAFHRLANAGQNALATRVSSDVAPLVMNEFPDAIWNERACTIRMMNDTKGATATSPLVVTAGTTDRGIAEEAVETLHWMNFEPKLFQDVGVAGPERLLSILPQLKEVPAIVVVAGMEGALPSVVGGWVSCPVIAVPTSVGYGANLGGMTALLGMLNSCASNVCVVNIDAGFKGGYLAGMIASQSSRMK